MVRSALAVTTRSFTDKLQELTLLAPQRVRALEVLLDGILEELHEAERFKPEEYRRAYRVLRD